MRTGIRNRRRLSGAVGARGLALFCVAVAGHAQSMPDMQQVMDRLDRLERQNRELMEEVRALRAELASARREQPVAAPESAVPEAPANTPTLEERMDIEETRTADLASSRVEASRHFPIRVTGMALFNTYFNSARTGDIQYPTAVVPGTSRAAGATFRQTILGFDYRGPETVWNGKVRGSLFMDFFGGSGRTLDQLMRLRTAQIGIDWRTRGVEFGLEKPLISPREPDSLAQVGVSPLTGAGNLWLWIPQARFEQKIRAGDTAQLRLQVAAVQTQDAAAALPASQQSPYPPYVEQRRPGIEARFEVAAGNDERRIEIAPGFHRSVSHINDISVPANIFSTDWLVRPLQRVEFTGEFFTGQNFAPLGTGAYEQGYQILYPGRIAPVHSRAGWTQATLRATPRLSFHLFAGEQRNRSRDLSMGGIVKNLEYGGNFFYRLAPSVILSFEASQLRTTLLAGPMHHNNHYDLALAYLF